MRGGNVSVADVRGSEGSGGADVLRRSRRVAEDFESFYRREYRGVVALAFALSGSRHAAEDIAQDSFLAAHRRWEEIGRHDQPLAWLRRVVANKSASAIRRRVAEARALTRLAGRSRSVIAPLEEHDAVFWRAVRALPVRQRHVVALHYLFDLSVVDVAATLDISDGAVKAHLHKARASLARRLSLREGDDG